MRRRVYIETTIPSFYFETRAEADMVARRNWTREWWEKARARDELVTSEAVVEELSAGRHPHREDCLAWIADLPLIAIESAVAETVEAYIAHKLMPSDPGGDALHLALASHYRCDFLATWNCRHLANANKFDHVRRINGLLGLFVPALVTPLELLGENTDDE